MLLLTIRVELSLARMEQASWKYHFLTLNSIPFTKTSTTHHTISMAFHNSKSIKLNNLALTLKWTANTISNYPLIENIISLCSTL